MATPWSSWGSSPGEHVIVYAGNSLEHYLAGTGARAAGLIPAPMNHRLVAEEVAYILDHSDAAAVFVSDQFLPVCDEVRPGARKVRHWILMGDERRDWAVHLDDLLARGGPEPVELPAGAAFGASIIYTGGTTGKPKGALRRSLDPQGLMETLGAMDLLDPNHVHLVAGPMYHSAPGGLALYAHIVGATVVIMPKFDPERALAEIQRRRCSSTFMAPTLLKRIMDLPASVRARYDVSSMRAIIMAAAPCPMSVKEAVVELLRPRALRVLRLERARGEHHPEAGGRAAKAGLVRAGRAGDGRSRCWTTTAGPCPWASRASSTSGSSPASSTSTTRTPAATASMRRGEWYSVGDVAYMDADGFYYICDRKRDMIISAGVNIYPAEIEDALHRHPDIQDVAVFGVPDDDWGERVHAAVQPRPARAPDRRRRDRLRAPAPGRLQGAARGDLPRGLSARPRGQAHQARAARALLGRPRDADLSVRLPPAPLTVKITVLIVVVLIVGFGISTILTIQREADLLVEQSKVAARRLTAALTANIEAAMLQERPDIARMQILEMQKNTPVEGLTVYRRNGVEAFTDTATLTAGRRRRPTCPRA